MVNNYKAANTLQGFKNKYMNPLSDQVEKARDVMNDTKQKWEGDQKIRAEAKFILLDTKNIDFHRLYKDVFELISQHEELVHEVSMMYAAWYETISSNGNQPIEMMESQAEALGEIFAKMYELLEPLKLDLTPPKK